MSEAPPTQMRGAGPRPQARQRPRRRSLGRYLFMPVVLALVLVALYVYVSGQELDSIEARSLNASALTTALWEHVQLTAASTLITLVIAIPLGVVLTRRFTRRARPYIIGVLTVLQAVPTIAIIVLLAVAW